ncbi:AsmA family protein [Coxiella endosymbiont of Ornithodoros maritimus]|uniref:AsmA family protein n=1 Tax=Coxiella endosymbiont of Ornithodoros maritimus TaxID=1656172 RepID=UPI002264AE4E|nr:AsmA family protein [Coxiella endosymbiont of Ornithodoros maritimus]
MRTFIKILVTVVVALFLVSAISVIALTKLLNSNDYKDRIDHYVYNQTGRHLMLKGNLGWFFIPCLGVDLKQVELSNPVDFQGTNLASIGEIKIKVHFWPLLMGRVELDKITLDKATINLIKHKSGKDNWAQWNHSAITKNNSKNTTDANRKMVPPVSELKIAGINISNTTINLIDQKSSSITSLKGINLTTGHIGNAVNFPVSMQFTLASNQSKNTFNTTLTADADLNFQQSNYSLSNIKFNGTLLRPSLPPVPVNIVTNLTVNLNQQNISISPLNLKLANMQLNGKIEINQLQTPHRLSIKLGTVNTDLKQLLTALRGKSPLAGQFSFDTVLTTSGNSKEEFLSHLNGSGKFAVQNGTIWGININGFLAQANALLTHRSVSQLKNSKTTAFSNLTGTYMVKNGILNNNDLKMNAAPITAKGLGTINLMDNRINYTLTTAYTKSGAPPQFEVPILIHGTVNSPTIRPDFSTLASKILTNELEKKVKQCTGGIKKLNLNNYFR